MAKKFTPTGARIPDEVLGPDPMEEYCLGDVVEVELLMNKMVNILTGEVYICEVKPRPTPSSPTRKKRLPE